MEVDRVFRVFGINVSHRVCGQCGFELGKQIPCCGNLQHAIIVSPVMPVLAHL